MVAAVGDEEPGRRALSDLRREGVDTDFVALVGDRPTGLATICVDATGENFVVVSAGANGALTPDLVAGGLDPLRRDDVCVVNFEIPQSAAEEAARTVAERGARLVVNPSPVRALGSVIVGASPIVVANAGELRELTGAASVEECTRALVPAGCSAVVTTLGPAGARVTTADGEYHQIAAHRANPVDTTGAGDTFTGVLAAGLAGGEAIVAAARRAVIAAALSTEAVGARAGMPTSAVIDRVR